MCRSGLDTWKGWVYIRLVGDSKMEIPTNKSGPGEAPQLILVARRHKNPGGSALWLVEHGFSV
jgi:hypothetical protein